MRTENPWWGLPHRVLARHQALQPRRYLARFRELATESDVRRAVLLLGPRRVGKTVLLHHLIDSLLTSGIPADRICYLSVDHPLYNGRGLESLLALYQQATGVDHRTERCVVIFDEIQYLRDWERHLKSLVDAASPARYIASGSAAAALRMKSQESGAGRFTEFLLPPLTFDEYLRLSGQTSLVAAPSAPGTPSTTTDINALNAAFVQYINFGGYPEVALSATVQSDPGRFVRSDIIDKVLLRDLPSLYGIQDIQELNSLFTMLAYNSAQEVSLEQLSKRAGIAKNTIKRYIEYLEAAYLLRTVHRLDRSGKRFQRATAFKVYLTNPSIRAALFSPITDADAAMGAMTETAIFAQWFHAPHRLHYGRWRQGEVDIVSLTTDTLAVDWALEVKWSDRYVEHPRELSGLLEFMRANGLAAATVTSRTLSAVRRVDGLELTFVPASLYCHTVGSNALERSVE